MNPEDETPSTAANGEQDLAAIARRALSTYRQEPVAMNSEGGTPSTAANGEPDLAAIARRALSHGIGTYRHEPVTSRDTYEERQQPRRKIKHRTSIGALIQ
jgi:hypothetical protein